MLPPPSHSTRDGAPKAGAAQSPSVVLVELMLLFLLLLLLYFCLQVNTKQLWCSEVTFWSMCSSPWSPAKATIVDFMPRLGRTLAPSHCFLWLGSMDSQPGKKAPF